MRIQPMNPHYDMAQTAVARRNVAAGQQRPEPQPVNRTAAQAAGPRETAARERQALLRGTELAARVERSRQPAEEEPAARTQVRPTGPERGTINLTA